MSELTRERSALTRAILALKTRVAIPTKRVGKTAISVAVGPLIPMPHDDAFGTSVTKKSAPLRMSVTIKKGDHPGNWRPKGIRKMTYAAGETQLIVIRWRGHGDHELSNRVLHLAICTV